MRKTNEFEDSTIQSIKFMAKQSIQSKDKKNAIFHKSIYLQGALIKDN